MAIFDLADGDYHSGRWRIVCGRWRMFCCRAIGPAGEAALPHPDPRAAAVTVPLLALETHDIRRSRGRCRPQCCSAGRCGHLGGGLPSAAAAFLWGSELGRLRATAISESGHLAGNDRESSSSSGRGSVAPIWGCFYLLADGARLRERCSSRAVSCALADVGRCICLGG